MGGRETGLHYARLGRPDMLPIMKRAAFVVRPGDDADWPALGRALADLQDFERDIVGYPLRPGCDVWQDYLADLRQRVRGDQGVFLVAETGADIVGVLAGYVHQARDLLVDPAFDRSGYISDLFVNDAWRRRGVGTALMRAFEQIMRGNGLQWLSVCVKSRNTMAREAYRSHGFDDYETILTKRLS
jgi:ribosomal protein S18 acetylase RimI-like enzyme